MTETTSDDCILFKALGDKTRYQIVNALLKEELCACELPEIVKRAQPTVSLQLKYLANVGVLSSRRDGKRVIYRVADQRARRLMRMAGAKQTRNTKRPANGAGQGK